MQTPEKINAKRQEHHKKLECRRFKYFKDLRKYEKICKSITESQETEDVARADNENLPKTYRNHWQTDKQRKHIRIL